MRFFLRDECGAVTPDLALLSSLVAALAAIVVAMAQTPSEDLGVAIEQTLLIELAEDATSEADADSPEGHDDQDN